MVLLTLGLVGRPGERTLGKRLLIQPADGFEVLFSKGGSTRKRGDVIGGV
jgi:hypothetical protein